jgi:hypothetical protein
VSAPILPRDSPSPILLLCSPGIRITVSGRELAALGKLLAPGGSGSGPHRDRRWYCERKHRKHDPGAFSDRLAHLYIGRPD